MTVTPYVDMCNMDFIQFHSRKDNTEKKLNYCSNFIFMYKHMLGEGWYLSDGGLFRTGPLIIDNLKFSRDN
jgi:hypothetical protein